MAGAVAKPLSLRLFLEGVEVPVVSASVQIGLNAPAVASIQVVPLDEATELLPRTMVHLFFLDHYDVETPTDTAPDTEGQDRAHPDLRKNYRLLFTGEMVGFSFVKTPQSRAVILQCLDFSSYWDSCHATSIDWGPNGNAFYDDSFLTASDNSLFDNIVSHQPVKILSWIQGKPETPSLKSVSGLAGGVIRMLEAIGGVAGYEKGVNDFFTVAELKCRILSQIAAEENDTSAADLLKGKVFVQWLKNGLENIGLQVTFRDMLKLLFQYIYYDTVPNPAPYFIPAKAPSLTTEKVSGKTLSQHPVGRAAIEKMKNIEKSLREEQNNRVDSGSAKSSILGSIDSIDDVVRKLSTLNARATTQILERLHREKETLLEIQKSGFDVGKNAIDPLKKVAGTIRFIINVAETSTVRVTSSRKLKSDATGSRLITQIFRPDVFFAAPPRCNIIFPEHYTQLAYDRNFLSEATRAHILIRSELLTNGPGNEARMFSDSIVVPSIGKSSKVMTKNGGPATYRGLMDHELHTGILPRSEWIPDSAAGNPKEGTGGVRNDRLSWGKKAALFHFFKYRFGSRTANLSGRFNPYLVCGFPGAIITRPLFPEKPLQSDDADHLETVLASGKVPMQIVGMIAALSHNVDQGGGTTSVMMHHARHHGGLDDEFLKIHNEEERILPRVVRHTIDLQSDRKDKKLLDMLIGVTPQVKDEKQADTTLFQERRKEILFRTDKVSLGVEEEAEIRSEIAFRKDVDARATGSRRTVNAAIEGVRAVAVIPNPPGRITNGSKGPYGGKIIGIEVVDGSITQVGGKDAYGKVIIYEEKEVKVTLPRPPESVMHPTWISNAYRNENIGKQIYQKFFGVDSITDEMAFTGFSTGDLISNGKGVIVDGAKYDAKSINKAVREFTKEAKNRSIERSMNFIAFVYGLARKEGKDIDAFIQAYNHRPIATLTDMLGSPDLELSVNADGSVEASKGTLGFHSLAVHPTAVLRKNLTGLLTDPDTQMNRLAGDGKRRAIPPGYDVRWESRERVISYLQRLEEGPAFQG